VLLLFRFIGSSLCLSDNNARSYRLEASDPPDVFISHGRHILITHSDTQELSLPATRP
jgi:hypothetical protein